jgi:hypothetical protein
VTPELCPYCLQRDSRYRGPTDSAWLPGFTCARCVTWHVERCQVGNADVCAACAPVVRLELQDRLCAATLDLIDALPPEETRHLESVFEQLERAVAFRVPMSGQPASLAPFARALADVMFRLEQLESPIEYDLHAMLDEAGLLPEFAAQVEIRVRYVGAGGSDEGKTTADFAHLQLRVAIYCDSHLHGELRTRELDNRVVEALQAAGWFVVRLTGREIQRRPEECLARIRRALERAAAQSAA